MDTNTVWPDFLAVWHFEHPPDPVGIPQAYKDLHGQGLFDADWTN